MQIEDKKTILLMMFLQFLCLILGGLLVVAYQDMESFGVFSAVSSIISEPNTEVECNSGSLIKDANCLRKELTTFYKYNISNVEITLSEEELKEQGGVCWHYSEWYTKYAKQNGYFAKEVEIAINITEKVSHQFTVMSSNEGYCILDQKVVFCVPLDSKGVIKGEEDTVRLILNLTNNKGGI